jgi:amino acid transporter
VAACDNKAAAIIIDPVALAAVIILIVILVCGVKESFWFNTFTVAVSLTAILMAIFLGALQRNKISTYRVLLTACHMWHVTIEPQCMILDDE